MLDLDAITERLTKAKGRNTEWRIERKPSGLEWIICHDTATSGETYGPYTVAAQVPCLIAPLLANAPTDIAALVAEVRSMSDVLDGKNDASHYGYWGQRSAHWKARAEAAEAALESCNRALRAAEEELAKVTAGCAQIAAEVDDFGEHPLKGRRFGAIAADLRELALGFQRATQPEPEVGT